MVDEQLELIAQGPIFLWGILHRLPQNPKKHLTNYDHIKKEKGKYHIDDFYLHMRMLEVHYDDVSCTLFLYTLEGITSVWYHILPPNSIHNWREFNEFLEKFFDDKSPSMSLKELSDINMGDK